jgi:hypothetical protein
MPTLFKLPVWGLPTHLLRNGLDYESASATSALFRVEAEAITLELMARYPNLTNASFLNGYAARLVKPLW